MTAFLNLLRRVRNELPATVALVTAVINTVLLAADSVPVESTVSVYAMAILLALLRFVVSPAFPAGSERALEIVNNADYRALQELAREHDVVAAEILAGKF